MPRKSLQIRIEVTVQAVTCPGVILKDRGDVFLRIVLLGCQKNSLCLPPVFPLLFHQTFKFERAFPRCTNLVELEQVIELEPVLVELIQLDEETLTEGAKVIAFYHSSVKEFLFPEDSLIPTYADSEQEVLMQRSTWFSGIAPKFEFSSKTTIRDTSTSFLDSYYENAAENSNISKSVSFPSNERSHRKQRRTYSYEHPTTSSRLKSPSLSSTLRVPRVKNTKIEDRAPFIVKRKDSFNRALSPSRVKPPSPRRPASAPPKATFKRRSLLPSQEKVTSFYIPEEECRICQVYQRYLGRRYWGHKKYYHPSREISPKKSYRIHDDKGVDEYRKFPHQELAKVLDDDTEDIISKMNGLYFEEGLEDPVPGLEVTYGRLPYSPRVTRHRSRSPIRLRARSASPRGRSTRGLDISSQIQRRVQRALEDDYISDDSEISSITSDEALQSLRESVMADHSTRSARSRRYINY